MKLFQKKFNNVSLRASRRGNPDCFGVPRNDKKRKTIKTASAILAVVLVFSGLILSLTSIFDHPQTAQAAWYSNDWNYRQKVIIDHTKVTATQTDFPVLIKITDTTNPIFSSKVQDDGDDIRFTSSNETTDLSFEVESYSKTTHELWAWVKIPSLSAVADTVIYLYYGNAGASGPSAAEKQAVWSNGYAGVWHLKEGMTSAVDEVKDSTPNSMDGTSSVGISSYIGKIGSAMHSPQNSNTGIALKDVYKAGAPAGITMQGWVNIISMNNASLNWGSILVMGDATTGYFFGVRSSNQATRIAMFEFYRRNPTIEWFNGSPANLSVAAGWHHLVMVGNSGSVPSMYLDGNFYQWSGSTNMGTLTTPAVGSTGNIGGDVNGVTELDWAIDESRVSNVARSATWVSTEYANQNSPETFAYIAGEVTKTNYTIPIGPAGWYENSWGNRQPITLNPTSDKVPNTSQTDFPTLIKITDVSNNIWAKAQADGDDILFTSADGTTKLAHEIEKYNAATHELWAWVKVPTLATGATTGIYMYYGNAAAANQQSKTAVWSNGYKTVLHMAGANGATTFLDSSAVNKPYTTFGSAQISTASSKIGGSSGYFVGSSGNSWLRTPYTADLNLNSVDWTMEAWFNSNSFANFQQVISKDTYGSNYDWAIEIPNSTTISLHTNRVNTSLTATVPTMQTGQWYHIAFTRQGGTNYLMLNGVSYNSNTMAITNDSQVYATVGVSGYNSPNSYFRGYLSEVKLMKGFGSTDWIATEYNNQNDPASFETFGAPETGDTFAPNNPTAVTGYLSEGGALITNNAGSDSTPYFSWPEPEVAGGATDQTGIYVSGVAGYYSYFGTSCGAGGGDPALTRGVLADTGSGLHYSADINVSVPDLTTNAGSYCLRQKTKDNAGNVSGVSEQYLYSYDTTNPNAPTFVAVNPAGYSSVDSFDFTWPAATDNVGGSGLQGYQYKRGSDADWGAIQAERTATGITKYQTGANIFQVRSVDNANNYSAEVQTTYYYSNEVPTKPTGVTAIPALSNTNSFAFSWTAPVLDPPGRPIVDYGYVINAVPTLTNLTWKGNATPTLAASHFATIQGVNTFYIVAKDDSGAYGIAAANYGLVEFNCTTVAPPIPIGLSISDSSNRLIDLWALTLKWYAGVGQNPATFAHYSIERSTDNVTFVEIATTASTAYVDATGLNNLTTYYYRIKAVDNADSASASSQAVSKMPSGKFDTPPTIVSGPIVSAKATTATISWVVNRASTSAVRFGKSASDLSRSQIDPTTQTSQSISLVGLEPSTVYYYQVQSLDALKDYSSESAYSSTYQFTTLASPNIANVEVSNITLFTASITWETSSASNTKVYFGTTIAYGGIKPEEDVSMTTRHTVNLSGLAHSSKYHFKIYGQDIDGNVLSSDDYTFETVPMPQIFKIEYQPDFSSPTPTVIITWLTNVPTTSSVKYSPRDGSGDSSSEDSQSALIQDHKAILSNLKDSTDYEFQIKGTDQFGNTVLSDIQLMRTGEDARVPKISNVIIENSNVGSDSNLAQLVVFWETDEDSTSQVEYGTSFENNTAMKKSVIDLGLTKKHLVIITGLTSAMPYHLRVISKDKAGNTATSENGITTTGIVQKTVFSIIISTLIVVFGWLGKMM